MTKVRAVFVSLLASLGIVAGAMAAPTPARAETPCSDSICFATVEDGFAFQSYPATTPRNRCEPVIDGQTIWIRNTSYYRWHVFDAGDCTGTAGIIYPRSEGNMLWPWYRTIGSTFRTSSTR